MASGGTEYSYTLPAGVREFWLKLRDIGYALQVAMVSGDSDITYLTVASGKIHKEQDLKPASTLYFRSSQANMVAEVLSFV